VAEGSENREREAADARRRQRADWFGQSLGDEWVEVEPGIYHYAAAPAEPQLDEDLLDALPESDRDTAGEESAPVPPDLPEQAGKTGLFHRRLTRRES
jgi:hypothetical protein